MMRRLIRVGDRRLRRVAEAIANPESPQVQRLIEDLMGMMQKKDGVGIAAPQLAVPQRLFIVASRPNPRYPDAPEMEPTAMINPCLVDRSEAEELGWEGCLSVPNRRGQVLRARSIQVEYVDRGGNLTRSHFQGFIARIFQHELDHLDGILFIDRVNREEPGHLVTEQEFERLTQPLQEPESEAVI